MKLTLDDKNKVRVYLGENRLEMAIKTMLRFRMSDYDKLITKDKLFLNNNLAWAYKKQGKQEKLAQYYLDCSMDICKDSRVLKDNEVDYYVALWLDTELNEKNLTQEEFSARFIKIYKYHKGIKNKRFSYGAIQKIVFNKKDKSNIIKFMKKMIEINGKDDEMVLDMVDDCKNEDNHIYIEVKKILDSSIPTQSIANLY